jgi:hypothetical protein
MRERERKGEKTNPWPLRKEREKYPTLTSFYLIQLVMQQHKKKPVPPGDKYKVEVR